MHIRWEHESFVIETWFLNLMGAKVEAPRKKRSKSAPPKIKYY